MRIYLAHPNGAICACESEPSAAACEARGFIRCSYGIYRMLWRRKDRRAREAMAVLVERQVGEDLKR
jgi:hypothetical protein